MSDDLRIDLGRYVARAKLARATLPEGQVSEVLGMLVEVEGIGTAVGSQLETTASGRSVVLEVLGFRNGKVITAPLGSIAGLAPGARVRASPSAALAAVGPALLGRVIDAFGHPLDGGAPPICTDVTPLKAQPPAPFSRRPIREAIETRVRAIDALLPLGRGQRIGLFAGTGVGKSTLLGMLCRHSAADVIVVGLIGERGREVGDFVRGALGEEGLRRSVVVAATSDMPPFVRARGALRATAIAEHFRAQGKCVLLVMDSVTRYAMALREASLAAGEPPLTKGYTPTVFAALPALLERAGNTDGPGSITAVYTVLVEGDDLNDPIADAVRGILDGHIVLSRKLADRGLFPAIDVLRSVSRVVSEISTPEHLKNATRVRDLMATYSEAADLIQIGAYVAGSDPRIDSARSANPRIEAIIRQGLLEGPSRASSLQALRTIAESAP
jgi:flagellum-specific ATP synthase